MKGHVRNVRIGFRSQKKTRDLIKGLKPVRIFNVEDLKNIKQGEIAIVAKIGDKNKKEIAEYAKEEKNKILNLNPEKFLKELKEKMETSKKQQEEKKKHKEKSLKETEKRKKKRKARKKAM